jgi:hypothetical protein
MDELPADLPAYISEPCIKTLLAGLLRLHSQRLEKTEVTICLRGAYDVYATTLLKDERQQLTEEVLSISIPGWAFDWAVKKNWLPYPPQRRTRAPVITFDELTQGRRPPLYEPIPEAQLTTMLGSYKMTDPGTKQM